MNVEKLGQLRQILSDMREGYDVLTQGYQGVQHVVEDNFHLHRDYLTGLTEVSPQVKRYYLVAQILQRQRLILWECRRRRLPGDSSLFTPEELSYLESVYANVLQGSARLLGELTTVLTSSALRMTDAERLRAIDTIHQAMGDRLSFIRHFSDEAGTLSRQRMRELQETRSVRQLHNSPKRIKP